MIPKGLWGEITQKDQSVKGREMGQRPAPERSVYADRQTGLFPMLIRSPIKVKTRLGVPSHFAKLFHCLNNSASRGSSIGFFLP
jgi:hypothetical protein